MKSIYFLSEIVMMGKDYPTGQAAGCESRYIRISETEGIKVIMYPRGSQDMYNTYTTVNDYLSGKNWADIQRQINIMNMLAESRRAPKVYETMLVRDDVHHEDHRFYGAIRMEHIDFVYNHMYNMSPEKQMKFYKGRNKWLEKMGKLLNMQDNHEANLVWVPKEKRFMLLDFGNIQLVEKTTNGILY